jgi:hypothetical protein
VLKFDLRRLERQTREGDGSGLLNNPENEDSASVNNNNARQNESVTNRGDIYKNKAFEDD